MNSLSDDKLNMNKNLLVSSIFVPVIDTSAEMTDEEISDKLSRSVFDAIKKHD